MNLINSTKDTKERISRLLEMHANQRKERDEFYTGDIAACIGLKKATQGILSVLAEQSVLLEKWNSLSLLSRWLSSQNLKADREKLAHGPAALSEEDPTFRVSTNEETGQTIIAGMGELHLEILA